MKRLPQLHPPHPPPRGIRNVTTVSCHLACAVQILCHAIPPIRQALVAIMLCGDTEKEEEEDDRNGCPTIDSPATPPSLLLVKELVDYINVDGTKSFSSDKVIPDQNEKFRHEVDADQPHHPAWDPSRLYSLLKRPSTRSQSSLPSTTKDYVLDPDEVGDASTSLSFLLHRLQQVGPEWDALLRGSVWEGQTKQVLEGRKRVVAEPKADDGVGGSGEKAVGNVRSSSDDHPPRGGILQRIKVTTKCKPLACPLVLKVNDAMIDNPTDSISLPATSTSKVTGKMGDLCEALQYVFEPQIVDGTPYPWDDLNPDTFTERTLMADLENNDSRLLSDDGNGWVTTKRIYLQRVPRILLLHLDRRRGRQLQQKDGSMHPEKGIGTSNEQAAFSTIDIPMELETKSLLNMAATSSSDTEADSGAAAPSQRLTLRGAILQHWEVNKADAEVDDLPDDQEFEGHCVTLLRTDDLDRTWLQTEDPGESGDVEGIRCNDNAINDAHGSSWVLVDDEHCQDVDQDRALALMGGILDIDIDDDITKFYAASLLVYAIPDDTSWNSLIEDVVTCWKSRRAKSFPSTSEPSRLVGKCLRVKWAKGKYYSGRITHYDESTGKHRVMYDDGDVKEYDLAKKTIEWIDDKAKCS